MKSCSSASSASRLVGASKIASARSTWNDRAEGSSAKDVAGASKAAPWMLVFIFDTAVAWRALGLWTVVWCLVLLLLLSVANGGWNGGRCCEWGLVLRMGARRGEIAGFVANGGSNVGWHCEWGLRRGAIAGFGALRSLRSQFIFRESAPSAHAILGKLAQIRERRRKSPNFREEKGRPPETDDDVDGHQTCTNPITTHTKHHSGRVVE